MKEIYNEIIAIKIDKDDSFQTSMNKFYDVMRKYNIKWGTKTETGCTGVSAEWNMCYAVFEKHKILELNLWMLLQEIPTDLKH